MEKLLSSRRNVFQKTLITIDKPLLLTRSLVPYTYLGVHKYYFGGKPVAKPCHTPSCQGLAQLQHAFLRLSMALTCIAMIFPQDLFQDKKMWGEPP